MKRLQAYQFELTPNGALLRAIRCYAGSSDFVFNKALDWQNTRYKADTQFKFSYTRLAKPQWKQELPWLNAAPSQCCLQQSIKHCSCCGKIDKANRPTQAKFACVSCGYTTNADVNAANNIKAAGHAVLACRTDIADSSAYIRGEDLGGLGEDVLSDTSVKHEPTEETNNHNPMVSSVVISWRCQ